MHIRIHSIIQGSLVNGPGNRYVIWMQGCNRRCFNCYNKKMQNKNGGEPYKTEEIVYNIINSGLDGVTISGGEPFDQPEALFEILEGLNKSIKSFPNGIISYTGYSIEEILNNPLMSKCVPYIDLIIDGPYIDEFHHEESLSGSSNQRYIYSDKEYRGKYLLGDIINIDQAAEIHIDPDSSELLITGFPDLDVELLRINGIIFD